MHVIIHSVIFSSTFGLALLAILGACLLHLVATAYFFLLEILGEKVTIMEMSNIEVL